MKTKYIGDYANGRNNNFDFIRFVVATLIIFFHAFPLSGTQIKILDGWYPLGFVVDGQISLGDLCVSIFFMISGFLITQSWDRRPNIKNFFKKRILRIIPGLTVAVIMTAFVLGPIFTTLPLAEYFQQPAVYEYSKNIFLYDTWFVLPGVFNELPYSGGVNGSLWTLKFEARCYLLVAVFGVMRLFDYKEIVLFIFLGAFVLLPVNILDFTVTVYFFMGAIFYLLRYHIPHSDKFATIAGFMVLLSLYFKVAVVQIVLLYGTYLLFYLVFHPRIRLHNFGRYGDFSYGLYIYAFPIQQMVVYYLQSYNLSPLAYFLLQYPLILMWAVLSWHVMEKRCLRLK